VSCSCSNPFGAHDSGCAELLARPGKQAYDACCADVFGHSADCPTRGGDAAAAGDVFGGLFETSAGKKRRLEDEAAATQADPDGLSDEQRPERLPWWAQSLDTEVSGVLYGLDRFDRAAEKVEGWASKGAEKRKVGSGSGRFRSGGTPVAKPRYYGLGQGLRDLFGRW
jgi:hypothetical protein